MMGTSKNWLSVPIANRLRVNVKESEGERTGIIRRQFCGARQVRAIFRGALKNQMHVRARIF
jgi:hypothetical protein